MFMKRGVCLSKHGDLKQKNRGRYTSLCDVRYVPRAVHVVYVRGRGYAVVRHLHGGADDDGGHVQHVHAYGCGGLLHDERILELAHPHVLDQ